MSNSWRQPAYLHKRSAVTERDGVDESVVKVTREIMPDCVLSLVGCRTVCCHLWDAGLCVVPCGMQDCVLSLVGCRTVCSHLCESCIQILSVSHILDIRGVKVSYLFLHFALSVIFLL